MNRRTTSSSLKQRTVGKIEVPIAAQALDLIDRMVSNRDLNSHLDRLLARSKKGDRDSWNVLVHELQSLVYSIPRRYRLNDDDAADVFLITFETLYKNLDTIENGQSLPKWMATTASRECLRIIRFNDRSRNDTPLEDVIAGEEADAEKEAVSFDEAYRLRKAVGSMPEKCRDLLTALYLDEESSYTAISERLGVPVGAIGPNRARCLEKLRRILEKEGFFE